jgi:hypothetical protein
MQDYLQDQVVQHYASRVQRAADGPAVPTEGMVSWLEDERVLEVVVGGAWMGPHAQGLIHHASQAAGSAAVDSTSFTRLVGNANAGVQLYPGRVYEVKMLCSVVAGVASTQHEAVVKMTPTASGAGVATDPTVSDWRGVLGGVGAPWAWNGETSPITFAVNTAADYTFSPWFRRTGGTGTTQLTVHPASALLTIKVFDVGSLAQRASRQSTNEDTILTL